MLTLKLPGIGAEYPLSALIAAEWSATSTRSTMLAGVFLMQPVGQFLAYLVGFLALQGISSHRHVDDWNDHSQAAPIIDAVWRCVIGVGGFPALLAIALRLSIPETPRFLIDVKEDLPGAAQATRKVFPKKSKKSKKEKSKRQSSIQKPEAKPDILPISENSAVKQNTSTELADTGLKKRKTSNLARSDTLEITEISDEEKTPRKTSSMNGAAKVEQKPAEEYRQSKKSGDSDDEEEEEEPRFWDDWQTTYEKGKGFRRALAGIAICWFILDLCVYGLGLDTPRTLAKLWGSHPSDVTTPTNATGIQYPNGTFIINATGIQDWKAGFASQDDNIYDALRGDAVRALYTISVSSIIGSVAFLLFVNYIPRVTVLRWTFVLLAILFAITGSSFTVVSDTDQHSVAIVFYALTLFILNLGPNTILFMLPAELFPTKYRGTCYGIAAASGKVGAIAIQLIVHFKHVTDPSLDRMPPLSIMLMCFTPLMLIGAFFAWIWIPEVQHLRNRKDDNWEKDKHTYKDGLLMPPRSLEEITNNPIEGQIFGLKKHFKHLFRSRRKRVDSHV